MTMAMMEQRNGNNSGGKIAANLSVTAADGATLMASLHNGQLEFVLKYDGREWNGHLKYRSEDTDAEVSLPPVPKASRDGADPTLTFRRPVGRPRTRPRSISADELMGADV